MSTQHEPPVQVESQILTLRRHGRVLVLPVLVLVIVAGAASYFIGTLPEQWMNLAAAIGAAVVALLLGLVPVLRWLNNRATITNRRVIMRRGVFVQHRSEVPLSRVREVRSKRGPMQRMFGSGDVELLVGVEAPVRLRDVPGPVVVADALQELIEQNYLRAEAEQGLLQPRPPGPPGPPHGAGRPVSFTSIIAP